MKRFIGYFDLLGYKQFILNNETKETRRRIEHVLRDIEVSLGRGEYKDSENGALLADLKKSSIQCLNISDTVIFWTKDDSLESLTEFLEVCDSLNWRLNLYNFPVRGALIYDELEMIVGKQVSEGAGMYNVNNMYGKGLIYAHIKCESQLWAGCTVDHSLADFIAKNDLTEKLLDPIAIKYMVPYKKAPEDQSEEYVLKLVKGFLNEIAYDHYSKGIIEVFKSDNKGINKEVQVKINNTIKFLDQFKAPVPEDTIAEGQPE